jgi:UDP-N-acetylglucosamine 2-epimerase
VASDYPFLEKKKKVGKMNTTRKNIDIFGNSVEIVKKDKKKRQKKKTKKNAKRKKNRKHFLLLLHSFPFGSNTAFIVKIVTRKVTLPIFPFFFL